MKRYEKKMKPNILTPDQDLSHLTPQHRWSVKNREKLYSYQKKYRKSKKYQEKELQKKWARDNSKRFLNFTDEEFNDLCQKVITGDLKKHQSFLDAYLDYHRKRLKYQDIIDNKDMYQIKGKATHYKISKVFSTFTHIMLIIIERNDKKKGK